MADFGKYYRAYMYMQELLQNDFTYNYINESLKDGDEGKDSLDGKTNEKVIDMDWVEAIEEAIPYIQKAIDEQRRFIKQIDNVVRVELARQVGPDSVKHLAQHTNFIAKVEGDMVTPNKVLTIEREESFAIYENRVLMTLIRRALFFVDDKYSKMKDVPNDSYNNMKITRHLELNDKVLDFSINYVNESHEELADDLDVLDVEELSDFDRIRKIRATLNEFLNTQLMKEIAKEPEVRPPLTQTNLLKKNPNFKKAVELWSFLDSYKRPGFEIVGEEYEGEMTDEIKQDVYFSMGFQHFIMTLTTNPGLRNLLQQKYEEENARIAEEQARPEKLREAAMQARIDEIRKEEMEIRLREIREREKKIVDLTNEVKNLKVTLEQKEQQILALKGQISMLQDEIAELKAELKETKLKLLEAENEIKRLKAENEALKAEIVELKDKIEKLNKKIEELNDLVAVLNDRIQVLMQENARQQTVINEQKAVIEQQTAKIEELEALTAEQLAKITALSENLERCEAEIVQKDKKINQLTESNEKLTNTLQTERKEHQDKIQKMNAEFARVTKESEERHEAEVKKLQNNIDEAEAKHSTYVAKLNAEFAEKLSKAEQKRIKDLTEKQNEFDNQLVKVKKSNEHAAAAVNAKHTSEIKKVQKSVDRRVEAVKRDEQKHYNSLVKQLVAQHNRELAEVKRNAKAEVRLAQKKAREEIKLIKIKARKKMFTEEELNNID